MEQQNDRADERGNRQRLNRLDRSFLVGVLTLGILLATPAQAVATLHQMGFVKRTPAFAMVHARKLIKSPTQWTCLRLLWTAESNWRPNAYNHTAVRQNGLKLHAGGIPQILGMNPKISVESQIQQGLKYITNRYKTPCQAWNFHLKNNWY